MIWAHYYCLCYKRHDRRSQVGEELLLLRISAKGLPTGVCVCVTFIVSDSEPSRRRILGDSYIFHNVGLMLFSCYLEICIRIVRFELEWVTYC